MTIANVTLDDLRDAYTAVAKAEVALRDYNQGTNAPSKQLGRFPVDEVDDLIKDAIDALVGAGGTPDIPPGSALVESGDTVPVQGVSGTAVVAGGALTGVTLPGTSTVVSDGDTSLTVEDAASGTSTGTVTVSAGALSSITLAGTDAIVSDSQVLPEAGGGTITLAIVDGVITATYTAP